MFNKTIKLVAREKMIIDIIKSTFVKQYKLR